MILSGELVWTRNVVSLRGGPSSSNAIIVTFVWAGNVSICNNQVSIRLNLYLGRWVSGGAEGFGSAEHSSAP